jgi:uncharacterized cupin superfamily protein
VTNVHDPDFDELREWDGFRSRRARIGRQLGTTELGASLFEVAPGNAAYPYHVHYTEEELVVVLEGRPSLRTPDGWCELQPGEVVAFPKGPDGAHQIANRTDAPVRFLAISTQGGPDVVHQPDSNRSHPPAFERLPEGGGFAMWFHPDDERGYIDGENPPIR